MFFFGWFSYGSFFKASRKKNTIWKNFIHGIFHFGSRAIDMFRSIGQRQDNNLEYNQWTYFFITAQIQFQFIMIHTVRITKIDNVVGTNLFMSNFFLLWWIQWIFCRRDSHVQIKPIILLSIQKFLLLWSILSRRSGGIFRKTEIS